MNKDLLKSPKMQFLTVYTRWLDYDDVKKCKL